MSETGWFTEAGDDLLFQRYVQRMAQFRPHMERGRVTVAEARQQASYVANLLAELESRLDEETHELLTGALIEWSILQGMQLTLALEDAA